MKNKYNFFSFILVSITLFLLFFSKLLHISEDVSSLSINALFSVLFVTFLFWFESRILILLNVFGFLNFNLALLTNKMIRPELITNQLCTSLFIIKMILVIATIILFWVVYSKKFSVVYWKVKIPIRKTRIIAFYTLGTIILQLIIRWI